MALFFKTRTRTAVLVVMTVVVVIVVLSRYRTVVINYCTTAPYGTVSVPYRKA